MKNEMGEVFTGLLESLMDGIEGSTLPEEIRWNVCAHLHQALIELDRVKATH